MEVYETACKNCLLSKNRIVSAKRAKEIINKCVQDQSHFICHKATLKGKDICCSTFYKTLGYKSQLVRIMQRLGAIKFVSQPDQEEYQTLMK